MKSTAGTGDDAAGARQADVAAASRSEMACRAAALVLVAIFLASVARFYHPGTGFTALIGLPEGHDYEAPALRAIPHYDYPAWASYDGQFYAQRAFDPLVRDPAVDRAMDLAPFRARRILFSWTAYAAGLGRPAWILEAYALQNVVAWLLLAVLLTRWMPPRTPRGLAMWTACLFSHGLLWSVRFALLDGPSLLITAFAVKLIEDGHPLASAAAVGLNGLGRETNVLGVLAQPIPRHARPVVRAVVARGGCAAVRSSGPFSPAALSVCIIVPLVVQAAGVIARADIRRPWWRVAIGYVALMLVLDQVLWTPSTGAITRVLLPMTIGFNVLLAGETRPSRFWPWFVLGNLHVIPSLWVLPLF